MVAMLIILVMAFGANLAMDMAAAEQNNLRDSQAAPSAAPAQAIQLAPVMSASPKNFPGDPIGPLQQGAKFFPNWGCNYYHRGIAGNAFQGYGCGWGCW